MAEKQFTEGSRKKLLEKHDGKLMARAALAGGRVKELAEWLIGGWNRFAGQLKEFCRDMGEDERPSEFIGRTEFRKLLPLCIPDKADREKYLSVIDKSNRFQYSLGWERRSVRTQSYAPCIVRDLYLMYVYYRFGLYGCSLGDYLLGNMDAEKLDFKQKARSFSFLWQEDMLIAAELDYDLDHGRGTLRKTLEDIILGERNTTAVTTDIIRGIVKSSDTDLHALLGKFLLAARLQEGVRQAVCENMDCGTEEAFITLFDVITGNDLIRYSSVKRAAATWIGLFNPEAAERISARTLALMQEALRDEGARKAMLSGDDAMRIITALWAAGFHEAGDAVREMRELVRSGSRTQLLAAAYYNQALYSRELYAPCAEYAVERHADDMEIVAAFMPTYLDNVSSLVCAWWDEDNKGRHMWGSEYIRPLPPPWFGGDEEKAKVHARILKGLYDRLDKKEKVFSPCTFPWHAARISKEEIAGRLCGIAVRMPGAVPRETAYEMLRAASPSVSAPALRRYLRVREIPSDRDFAVSLLASRSLCEAAAKILDDVSPTHDNIIFIESLLRYKDAGIRKVASTILSEQGDAGFAGSLSRLLASREEGCRFAALSLILRLKDKDEKLGHEGVDWRQFAEAARAVAKPSEREGLLAGSLFGTADGAGAAGTDGGEALPDSLDGLYDKSRVTDISPDGLELDTETLAAVCKADKKRLVSIIREFDKLIAAHRSDQYTDCNGRDRMLGDKEEYREYGGLTSAGGAIFETEKQTDDLPFPDLWKGFYEEHIQDPVTLFQLYVICNLPEKIGGFDLVTGKLGPVFRAGTVQEDERKDAVKGNAMRVLFGNLCKVRPGTYEYFCPYRRSLFWQIIRALVRSRCTKDFLDKLFEGVIYRLIHDIKREDLWYTRTNWNKEKEKHCVLYANELCSLFESIIPKTDSSGLDDGEFRRWFTPRYVLARHAGFEEEPPDTGTDLYGPAKCFNAPGTGDYFRAYKTGIISLDTVYYGIIRISRFAENLRTLHFHKAEDDELAAILRRIEDTITEGELRRGDAEGSCSRYVRYVEAIYGGRTVLRLLHALGSAPLARSTEYGEGSLSRGYCLSHLIAVSRPLPGDTAEEMKAIAGEYKIKEQKLYDLAMYAPAWIPIIGEMLGVAEFERGCYYFIAHMKPGWHDERDASLIAKYTPLTLDELERGAFDPDWFTEMYAALGGEVFDKLYRSAKYISDGSRHARARKFADAALGRVTEEELEKEIARARNKDLLMSYPLIPMKAEEKKERILHRYEFLQKFRKESRAFGAQRRQSEGEALGIALENLSRAAGYTDVNRLNLSMECRLTESLGAVFGFRPAGTSGYSIRIAADEDGSPRAEYRNDEDGKILKGIPAALRKDKDAAELQETCKRLKSQHGRTRAMLEDFMTGCVRIPAEEIAALYGNPVISPLVTTLLFVRDDERTETGDGPEDTSAPTGFLAARDGDCFLVSYDGTETAIGADCPLRVAHPLDLFRGGHWHDWQRHIFGRQIVQPFKQVFRELYVKLDEELDKDRSYMFAGNQIQPRKAAACLRGRRWIAGYEEGLQKVFYKQNLIAEIYAQADWFSPADAECPAVEFVSFARRLYKPGDEERPLRIRDIPGILYSETMRDVDLAVSVAHAGGVDPETSHSTIEMRRAVCEFSLGLFNIGNVRFEGNFAIISGSRAEYTVHLGTGLVRKLAGSAINVVAVHSQQRGRLFLPFADEDPKTAEVLSKVLMFARDGKIKDPYILNQIDGKP
ncbi:MAG: DUF4132 domain-containing protein [Treponema sp.]|nr:DUF4132 domain-containing protein [Treponema sp.]